MLTRARRGCIVIGSRSTLISDPLWQQWLSWASARGAVCGESAKGNWVPKYLVDDRDGVWTVKASVIEEAKTGISSKKDIVVAVQKEAEPPKEEPEVADSWEDLGSPVVSPSGAPEQLEALLEEEDAEADASELMLPSRARAPPTKEAADYEDDGPLRPAVLTRAQELRDARYLEEPEAPLNTVQNSSGDGAQARDAGAAPTTLPSGDAADKHSPNGDQHSLGTPKSTPTSPMRNQALAKLGLLDELDLE